MQHKNKAKFGVGVHECIPKKWNVRKIIDKQKDTKIS